MDASNFPQEAQIALERAYAHKEKNEFGYALYECESAVRAAPNWAEAHNLRGVLLEALGKPEQAHTAYLEAIRLNPEFADAKQNLYELDAELQGKPKEIQPTVVGKTFGIRAVAYVVDTVATIVLTQVIATVSGTLLGLVLMIIGRPARFDESLLQCLDIVNGLVLGVLYFAIHEWLYGASVGKLIFGMRVVQQDGSPCTLQAGLIRGVARYIDGLFFALPAYFSMKASPLRQRLGDKSAKTIVVDRKDPFIRAPREWWWFVIALMIYIALEVLGTNLIVLASLR